VADNVELDLELRLKAIEHVLVHIGKIVFLEAGITPEQMKTARENGRENLLRETFPGLDPALADHVSAELADRVDGLLTQIEMLVTETYRKASRGEF
jgi:hypothetical protein